MDEVAQNPNGENNCLLAELKHDDHNHPNVLFHVHPKNDLVYIKY